MICCKPGTSSFLQRDAATAQMRSRGLVRSPLGPGLKLPPREGQKLRGLHKVYGSHLTLNLLPAPCFPPSLSTPTFTLILLASSLHPRPMLLPPEQVHLSHLWGFNVPTSFQAHPLLPKSLAWDELLLPWSCCSLCDVRRVVPSSIVAPLLSVLGSVYLQAFFSLKQNKHKVPLSGS